MGLAPYGALRMLHQSRPCLPVFSKAVEIGMEDVHRVSPVAQFTETGGFSREWTALFGERRGVPRPDSELDQEIAASAQWVIEQCMVELAQLAKQRTGRRTLGLAGGVALNCVANGAILRSAADDDLFIQPASSDDGAAVGNALLGWNLFAGERPEPASNGAYLGRPYTSGEIRKAIKECGEVIEAQRLDESPSAVAKAVADGQVVALFRGGSEIGPRALGHRSILADPRLASMRDHLNARVKHREYFRPFAAMVAADESYRYFDLGAPSPYMLLAARVITDQLPAVTHVDQSSRIQTVEPRQEPFLGEVLRAFSSFTGVPVVLNTSFNDNGEPLVESPADALRCFLRTEIDVLFLEEYRVTRRPAASLGGRTP
jgi:carbamoyltransferase